MYNNEFATWGGPIIMYLGGEWTIDQGWLTSGQMHDIAAQNGGMLFYTEHRFYGQSYPTA